MKVLSLISDGIDSPVAAYFMIKRGMDVNFLHFHRDPFGKVRKVVEKLCEVSGEQTVLYLIPHERVIGLVAEVCDKPRLTCVYCKVIMLRTAERICKEIGAKAVVTGDSLGQVASQTISNLYVEDSAVKIPVLRPLIGLDKVEIVKIARQAGTYELSILPSKPCQAVPKKPATAAKLEEVDLSIDVSEILEGVRVEEIGV
ncbi:MAG: hypothetical protein H0Z28_07770 [Archaeoglobus sp.]|nr:hypothetical protein [Archaeoglobus sp.]